MKVKSIISAATIGFLLISCSNPAEFKYEDSSCINGQLCYKPNPFTPDMDTILCINNVYVGFTGFDADYCSYVRNLLSLFGHKFTTCQWHEYDGGKHHWEYIADAEQLFFPICDKQFISIINPNTRKVADSVCLDEKIIYLKRPRESDNNRVTHFYVEDFVCFIGNDYMQPKFITDSITPSEEQIVCFDGHRGPYVGNSSLTNLNPNIFN